jgi:hypothetical protein
LSSEEELALPTDQRKVDLVADDGLSEAAILLLPDVWEFDYVDNRELAEGEVYDSVLVLTPKTGKRTESRIGFLEVREGTPEVGPT